MRDHAVSLVVDRLSGWRARRLQTMGVVVALALPVMASAEEVWVLPSDVTKTSVGTWATTADKSVYFSLAIPDDFDSFNRAVLLAVGTVHDAKEPILVDFIVDLSVSGHGLADDDYVDTAIIQATLTEGELTEIDISSLLAINYAPGVEYLSVRVEEDGPGNSQAFQLAGMRVAYTSTDGDTDPTNELNTNVQLNGTLLEVTDAGGTLSADLASMEESAEILAEEAKEYHRDSFDSSCL